MTPNDRRAKSAHKALAEYRQENDNQEALIDLLTDLKHWADKRQVDFDHALDVARMHYHHEVQAAEKRKAKPLPVGPHDRSWLG